jgi:hypothetical protein
VLCAATEQPLLVEILTTWTPASPASRASAIPQLSGAAQRLTGIR